MIFVPRTEPLFNTLPEVVPLQLFVLLWPGPMELRHRDKNLAKSVTRGMILFREIPAAIFGGPFSGCPNP